MYERLEERRDRSGRGLGLVFCRAAVKAQGGAIARAGARLPAMAARVGKLLALAALVVSCGCKVSEPATPATPPRPSAGCGGAAQAGGSFVREQLAVRDRTRSYHVRLPDGYRSARPYPLVFRFHGYSGDGLSGGLAIERAAGKDAIVVGPDGLGKNWTRASEAEDLRFFDALLGDLSRRYCVDLARIYAYGFSAGGGFSNLLGCRRADQLRAIAVIAGFDRGQEGCGGAVAAWFQHDYADPKIPIGDGEHARDRMRARNHCAGDSRSEGDCVRYHGCSAPVVWCATRGHGGGHEIDGERAPARVWAFFRGLR
jgi:poly(3-hydroxybutyrate) depolymerase